MKIHEYQAKEVLRKFGVPTPRSVACFSVDEAVHAAQSLGGKVWVVKAQIHAGGRGKGGGVKLAKSIDEAADKAITDAKAAGDAKKTVDLLTKAKSAFAGSEAEAKVAAALDEAKNSAPK